jgi:hypothetical protein
MEFVALVDTLGVIGLMVTGILFLAAIGLLIFDRGRLSRRDERHTTLEEHRETRNAA